MDDPNDFGSIFDDKVLKPQIVLPMKQSQDDWNNLYDVNRTVSMFNITVEEFGPMLTVFVEGKLERVCPANYKGEVLGETIMITENDGSLMVCVPTNINNWALKSYVMMGAEEKEFNGEQNKVALFEFGMEEGGATIPFSFCLHYNQF